ncbi:MAG TPA: DNA modification methylase [Microbacteriaceae bacterium]|nr:DNA modification methylase [Microbacteriaceae bacterium]
MLKTRIVTSIALAAGVALGASGCGFFVPQATTYEYAPSDGIDVDLPGADVRNLLLVTNSDAANVVFTGVNNTEEAVRISIKFVDEGSQVAQRNFTLDPGLNVFGVDTPEIIPVTGLMPGSMITAFLEGGGVEIEREVPVLDGTLAEYSELVP